MKKFKIRQVILLLLLFFSVSSILMVNEAVANEVKAEKVLAAVKNKTVKRELIKSKKQFAKSLINHFLKREEKIRFKVKGAFSFDVSSILSKAAEKDAVVDFIYDNVSSSRVTTISEGNSALYDITFKYGVSKKKVQEFAKEFKEIKERPTIQSEEELRKGFLENLYGLTPKFLMKISNNLYKKYQNDTGNFLKSLEDEPKYNDLMETDKINIQWNTRNDRKFTVLVFEIKSKISKEEAGRIIEESSPVIMSKEELINEILKKEQELPDKYSLNISDTLGYFNNGSEDSDDSLAFWDALHYRPEYNDLVHYNEDGSYQTTAYKGYVKFEKFNKYSLDKADLDRLKSYVTNWVSTNLNGNMTEEEKVRAINDFMVKEYRYTFGDRGELAGEEAGKEKLGKYSVYSCFALIDGKGGVCNAKANMFYRLAKEAGLEVRIVTGTGNGGAHAWNLVKVDGNWYHIDNTWSRIEGDSGYEYFSTRDYYLKGDETMRKDHSWDASKYPAAPVDYQGYVPAAYKESGTLLRKVA